MFTQFQSFPLEIRLIIWQFSLPHPNQHIYPHTHEKKYTTTPSLLLTCKESQEVFLSIYTPLAHPTNTIAPPMFVDLQSDLFHSDLFPRVDASVHTIYAQKIQQVKRVFIPIGAGSACIDHSIAFHFLTYHYTRFPQIEELVFVMIRREETDEGKGIKACERGMYLEYLKSAISYTGWNSDKWQVLAEYEWVGKKGEWKLPIIRFDVEDLVVDREVGSERMLFDMEDVNELSDVGVGQVWPPVVACTGG